MGLPALTAVGASLFTKLESLASSKLSKASSTPAPQISSSQINKDASSVSDPGMLFSQLQGLSQQNPTEFKKITAQVAQQLQAASGTSTSAASAQSTLLNQMASNFQHASQTGSFSDLFTHSPQTAATSAASGNPHNQYAASNGASDASTIHSIFSQALSKIQSDLSTNAALSVTPV